ncbi:MAG: UPF0280 family protein [Rhodospirillales bacterium]|nr:MAG: UPF0280 family protein [Rhodospirillales bacterium]
MAGPVATMLPDGRRLHLRHGPIDLVIEAWGAAGETAAAYRQAVARSADILDTLAGELAALRAPVAGAAPPAVRGPVARRMAAAVWPHRAVFITPMAAVAGSVADETLVALTRGRTLERAYVNNGGDIAFHLAPGHALRLGVVADVDAPALDGFATLDAAGPSRGLATSGWRGRSFSLGIADAVTVFADTAAAADAAATIVANAVDADHPAIARAPARSLDPDSDLGGLPVTTVVGTLPPGIVDGALDRGASVAGDLLRRHLIHAATLMLQGRTRVVGALAPAVAIR